MRFQVKDFYLNHAIYHLNPEIFIQLIRPKKDFKSVIDHTKDNLVLLTLNLVI